MADIRATPVSNRAAYYLAGLLDSANEAVSKPFGYENDPVRALTNLLGVPSAVKTLENVAYGMPNTTGTGMATQLRPEAKETVANLLPLAPGASKAAVKGAIEAGKYAAPKVGQMAEQYAVKTGLLNQMIAYHGSPYSFDAFDLAHVGKGEGAQAYGHGMYFAESPKVAGEYRRVLTNKSKPDGIAVGLENTAWQTVRNAPEKPTKELIPFVQNAFPKASETEISTAIDKARGLLQEGSLYKVDIPDPAVATFLDWDKPLSQQPHLAGNLDAFQASTELPRGFGKAVEQARKRSYFDGNDLYRELVKVLPPEKISSVFQNSGIQGIRYLDGGSRGTGAGTSNFVVFDPSIVKILERNGQPMGLLETPTK